MHAVAQPLADEAQPGNAGMGGFRHRSLHVEMKDGFRAAGPLVGQAPPAGIAHARRAIPGDAIAHEIDMDVILVRRPMAVEIIEEGLSLGERGVIAEELQLVGLVGWRRNKRERTCTGRKNLGRPTAVERDAAARHRNRVRRVVLRRPPK